MSSHILKPKKEGRNPGINLYTKNYNEQQSSAFSQDKKFPLFESYYMLMEKDKEKNEGNVISNLNNNRDKNKYEMNCLTNNSNINIGNNLGGYLDLESDGDKNESKLEAKQVEDLKDCVNKILNEF